MAGRGHRNHRADDPVADIEARTFPGRVAEVVENRFDQPNDVHPESSRCRPPHHTDPNPVKIVVSVEKAFRDKVLD